MTTISTHTFKWRKLGRVFNPADVEGRPWMREFAQGPSVVLFETFVRVYFSCRSPADASGAYISYSAFVDLDRRDLFRIVRIADDPILELGPLGTFDEFGTYPVSVARDEAEFVAYYGGWTRCESVPFNVAIGSARSQNGEKFNKLGPGPVLGYSPDEPFVVSGPKIRRIGNVWYLWYIAGRKWKIVNRRPEPVYKIRSATSFDGLNWTRLGRDLIESRIEPDEAQASPDVFHCNGRYHMFFCYRYSTDYRNSERGYRIGYATSADLVNWLRDDDRAGIDISPDGWDSETISYPHVFALDGQWYLLYLGNQVGRFGFGLAILEGAF